MKLGNQVTFDFNIFIKDMRMEIYTALKFNSLYHNRMYYLRNT